MDYGGIGGTDTAYVNCTLPEYSTYAIEPCVAGTYNRTGNDTVSANCSVVTAGYWTVAPCRRYGGPAFESRQTHPDWLYDAPTVGLAEGSIYTNGRDTAAQICMFPPTSTWCDTAFVLSFGCLRS